MNAADRALARQIVSQNERLIAMMDPAPTAPAKAAPRKARKAPATRPNKAARRAWNEKITALASHGRPAGTFKALQARWSEAQALRDAGVTPAKALKRMGL